MNIQFLKEKIQEIEFPKKLWKRSYHSTRLYNKKISELKIFKKSGRRSVQILWIETDIWTVGQMNKQLHWGISSPGLWPNEPDILFVFLIMNSSRSDKLDWQIGSPDSTSLGFNAAPMLWQPAPYLVSPSLMREWMTPTVVPACLLWTCCTTQVPLALGHQCTLKKHNSLFSLNFSNII